MSAAPAQPPTDEGCHLMLYDGVCGLCHRAVQFTLTHDRRRVFHFAPLQSPRGAATVERWGGDPDVLTTFFVVADYRTAGARALTKGGAALFVARQLGWPWKIAGVFRILPTAVLDRVYDFVARHRYRIFGRSEQCLAPRPEFQRRFVE